MRRGLAGALAFAVLLAVLGARPSTAATDDPASAATLLTLVNQERAASGLAPLVPRDDVTAIAVQWSHFMADSGTLSHNDGYFTRDTKTRIGAVRVGENVAKNIDLLDAHRRLMASPQHRANILDSGFNAIGIGVVMAPTGEYYVTEDFLVANALLPIALAPAPAPEPAPAPAPSTSTTTSSTSTSSSTTAPQTTTTAATGTTVAAPTATTAPELTTTTGAPAPEVTAPSELAASANGKGAIGPVRPAPRDGLPVLLVVLAAALLAADVVYVARNRKAIAA